MRSSSRNTFPWPGGHIVLPVIWLAVVCLLGPPALAAETVRVRGVVYTVGPDRVRLVWPNARLTLKNLGTGKEVAV